MFERITAQILNKFLLKYFDDDCLKKTSFNAAVWSGFLCLINLQLKVNIINDKFAAAGIPIEIIHCSIRKVEITVPWSQIITSSSTSTTSTANNNNKDSAIILLDGVYILAKINYGSYNDKLIKERLNNKRKIELEDALMDITNYAINNNKTNNNSTNSNNNETFYQQKTKKSWKEIIQERIKEGILPALLDCLQVHVRDLHIRIEDCTAKDNNPFAFGIIMESMHVQHDIETAAAAAAASEQQSDNKNNNKHVIYKVAELNRFGLYWNPLVEQEQAASPNDRIEQKWLHLLTSRKDIVQALDDTISRRSLSRRIPQHTYIIQPVDGYWNASIRSQNIPNNGSSNKKNNSSKRQPVIHIVCSVPDVTIQIRDFQFLQSLHLIHHIREYRYGIRHRKFRPNCSVKDNPYAWWMYAVTAVRAELTEKRIRWSWGRFRKKLFIRNRYCDLYERSLLPDKEITVEETNELERMEYGIVGDLSVQDIVLYRILVHRKVGWKPSPVTTESSNGSKNSWLRRKYKSFIGDDADEEEYQRLIKYMQNWSVENDTTTTSAADANTTTTTRIDESYAVIVELKVDKGQLSLFSPLRSTADQVQQLLRIQEHFIDFYYTGFNTKFTLLGDYETIIFDIRLNDFQSYETRSNLKKFTVIKINNHNKEGNNDNDFVDAQQENINDNEEDVPFFIARITKNAIGRRENDFQYGVHANVRSLVVDLVPDCEWIIKLKTLLQPIPQYKKVGKFWSDLDMAYINTWASKRLGLLAKAETALMNHKSINVNIHLECPTFRIETNDGFIIVVDFGIIDLTTGKLASIVKSPHLLSQELTNLSYMGETDSEKHRGSLQDENNHRVMVGSETPLNISKLRSSSIVQSFDGSVNLGAAFNADGSFADFEADENIVLVGKDNGNFQDDEGIYSYFYDQYELQYRLGGILLETQDKVMQTITRNFDVLISLHRSVIPADHTMPQFKACIMIESINIEATLSNVIHIAQAAIEWQALLSEEVDVYTIMPNRSNGAALSRQFSELISSDIKGTSSADDLIPGGNSFDEEEFFDAAEEGSNMSDHFSVLDDHWIPETDSVVDNENRSRTPSRRRRYRQSSVSDVSSLSEGSASRRRLFGDAGHLTAENLARLEEEDDAEESNDSASDSFHSAVSLSYLLSLARELDNDIEDVSKQIKEVNDLLTSLRRSREDGDSILHTNGDSRHFSSRKSLRVDSEKLQVALKALYTARSSVQSQIESFSGENNGKKGYMDGTHSVKAVESAHDAAMLIKSIKKQRFGQRTLRHEHNITTNLKREIIRFSFLLKRLSITLKSSHVQRKAVESFTANGISDEESFTICFSDLRVSTRNMFGETRACAGIGSAQVYHDKTGQQNYLITAGFDESSAMNPGRIRYPELEHTICLEEQFIKILLCIRQGSTSANTERSLNVVRVRSSIGSIELTPYLHSIASLQNFVRILKNEKQRLLKMSSSSSIDRSDSTTVDQMTTYFDVAVRFLSFRLHLCDDRDSVALFLLSDVASRSLGSYCHIVSNDKIRVDARCGNTQLIYVSDSGHGVELFGKQDVYCSSLFRFRLKMQVVPPSCTGGWVVDAAELDRLKEIPTASFGSKRETSAANSLVWNFHAGVKFDSIRSFILPNILVRLRKAASKLSGTFQKEQNKKLTSNTNKIEVIGVRGIPVRWRCDLSMKDFFLGVDLPNEGIENSVRRIDISFSIYSNAQLSSSHLPGISLNFAAKDIKIVRARDDLSIIKPTHILFSAEASKQSRFCCYLLKPQLHLPDDFPWDQISPNSISNPETKQLPTCFEELDHVIIEAGFFEINITPSVCLELVELTMSYKEALSGAKTQETVPPLDDHITRGQSKICFLLSLQGLSMYLCREKSVDGRSITSFPVVLTSLGTTTLSYSVKEDVSNATLVIEHFVIVDFLYKNGIKCFSLEKEGHDSASEPPLRLHLRRCLTSDREIYDFSSLFGKIQCLLLPSLVKSLFAFTKELKVITRPARTSNQISSSKCIGTKRLSSMTKNVSFKCEVSSAELILSSKDLPSFLRGKSTGGLIGCVTFRLSLRVSGDLDYFLKNEVIDTFSLMDDHQRVIRLRSSSFAKENIELRDVGAYAVSDLVIDVSEIQILRTAIEKKSDHPCCFLVSPPQAGEQRITNMFGFGLKHRCALIIPKSESNFCRVSHSIDIKAGFVDALVYISQSTGGMSDAFKVSVLPVLDLFKGDKKGSDLKQDGKPGIKDMIFLAPTTLAISLDGFKVTFVPGGATRLTESPILKFQLLNISAGGGLAPVKYESKILSETSLERINSLSSETTYKTVLGAWFRCNLAASYHNRRLVSWEPCIEPYRLNAGVGIDLARCLNQRPVIVPVEAWSNLHKDDCSDDISSSNNRRFRDIGRLLRSPFIGGNTPEVREEGSLGVFETHLDYCYNILNGMANSLIVSAMEKPREDDAVIIYSPGSKPMKWLNYFGYPASLIVGSSGPENDRETAFLCCMRDEVPLNVNLTGALIENLSEYLIAPKSSKIRKMAPHWIKNESGLTVRFQEVLDSERSGQGEKARKVILANCSEAPLSLKRSFSQSCDPHQAYIFLELGNFEETIERVGQSGVDISRGSRSSIFFYKVNAKIPVDTVGIHTYTLDWNSEKRSESLLDNTFKNNSPGRVLVRVALTGGIKVVSIESPLMLLNQTAIDIIGEAHDHLSVSKVWRCLIQKCNKNTTEKSSLCPVPVDLVPFLDARSCHFGAAVVSNSFKCTHESESAAPDRNLLTVIKLPRPYSSSSFSKGLVRETEKSFTVIEGQSINNINTSVSTHEAKRSEHVNLCSLRIGNFTVEYEGTRDTTSEGKVASPFIPEQRMLVFRSTMTIRNMLAVPVECKIKVRDNEDWTDLGIIQCADHVFWNGSRLQDDIDVQIRLCGYEGEVSRQFPDWSETVTIRGYEGSNGTSSSIQPIRQSSPPKVASIKVVDSSGLPLLVCISVNRGCDTAEAISDVDDIKTISSELPGASKILSMYCSYWIVDSTGLALQFKTHRFVAGQVDAAGDWQTESKPLKGSDELHSLQTTRGLGELLDDNDLLYLPSRISFQILMIGNENATHMRVRRRLTREETASDSVSPWSASVSLRSDDDSLFDYAVRPPSRLLNPGNKIVGAADVSESFALRSRLVRAPEAFGGLLGTRLIHVACRYAVINELGFEIEVGYYGNHQRTIPVLADGRPRPFHLDDRKIICFRPREYGWMWSGRFKIRKKRKEVIFRLKHKLKGHHSIVSVEFHSKKSSDTVVIIFRRALHAPYRIENQTRYPVQYHQVQRIYEGLTTMNSGSSTKDTVILPYHNAEFAWDEPEFGRRSILLQLAEFGDMLYGNEQCYLGSFKIDSIAPGSEVLFGNKGFVGNVVSDGPTRVLIISERETPGASETRSKGKFYATHESKMPLASYISVELSHGIGLSIVDWKPQELLFARIYDVSLSQSIEGKEEALRMSVGSIAVDNQLWVTPFPRVLLVGSAPSRRRHKRHKALLVSLTRKISDCVSYDDITLYKNVSFYIAPSILSVDGNLAEKLIEMIHRIKATGNSRSSAELLSRNEVLRKALNLGSLKNNDSSKNRSVSLDSQSVLTDDLYSAMDVMATVAIASKLRSRYRPPGAVGGGQITDAGNEESFFGLTSKPKHKVYIERLRISTASAEISWTGSLPMALSLPRLLIPALTFESLPLLLRPYSAFHMFGTAEEHLDAVKSHYISVWRAVDVVVGILARPGFLLRACVFTWRDGFASYLSSLATSTQNAKKSVDSFIFGSSASANLVGSLRKVMAPFANITSSSLQLLSNTAAYTAAFFRYDSSRYRKSSGLVRSRNPRLFANVGGKDLLVEYVEGENSGKALLSRVQMGAYLGEGYVYHAEDARVLKNRPRSEYDLDAFMPLILMLTCDRLMLLYAKLDAKFCAVVWETLLSSIVHVECNNIPNTEYDQVVIWYLGDGIQKIDYEHLDQANNQGGKNTFGLETLHHKVIFIPIQSAKSFMMRIGSLLVEHYKENFQ